jgi:hypothetical protein
MANAGSDLCSPQVALNEGTDRGSFCKEDWLPAVWPLTC